VLQIVSPSAAGSDLLSFAWALVPKVNGLVVAIGASRVGVSTSSMWSWVDGTAASNLNCGQTSGCCAWCPPWGSSQPDSNGFPSGVAVYEFETGQVCVRAWYSCARPVSSSLHAHRVCCVLLLAGERGFGKRVWQPRRSMTALLLLWVLATSAKARFDWLDWARTVPLGTGPVQCLGHGHLGMTRTAWRGHTPACPSQPSCLGCRPGQRARLDPIS
jgi:hypothetical protein